MKRILISLICILSILCIGCKKNKYKELTEIKETQIFSMEEEKYLIFVHKDNCSGCQSCISDVMAYNYRVENSKYKSKKTRIYGLNVSVEGEESSLLYRKYKGNDGQGENGEFFVDGCTKWGELYFGATPALILVSEKDGVKTSIFVTQGASNISDFLGKY